jgi:hypothetical protein
MIDFILNSQIMTLTEYYYDFVDNQLYPEIENLEKHRNGDASGNITGNQCSAYADCTDFSHETCNSTRRNLVDDDKLILVLEPF